jgi:hypothetical protein
MSADKKALDSAGLKKLLEYLVDHNDHHIEELEEWIAKVEAAGRVEVADELRRAVGLTRRIGECFTSAAGKL